MNIPRFILKQKSSGTLFGTIIMAVSLSGSFVSPSLASTNNITQSPCFKRGPIVYVSADQTLPPSEQKGSMNKPFATLSQAENANAKTVVIMNATNPLDGGILLKDGQALIGIQNTNGDYPILQNTSSSSNAGNAVVVQSGSVCIDGIHFDNTRASGINYDNANHLTVLNSLVTGYNQGEVLVDLPPPYASHELIKIYVGGIHAKTVKSGTTKISHVEIRDNHIGPGILELPYEGANRNLEIVNSDFSRIIQTPRATDNSIWPFAIAIAAIPVGETTKQSVTIKDSYFHDFFPPVDPVNPLNGQWVNNNLSLLVIPNDGAETNAVVEGSYFKNLSANGQDASIAIAMTANDLTPLGTVPSSGRSKLTSLVRNNIFEENIPFALALGIILESAGSIHHGTVKNNVFRNVIPVDVFSAGTAEEDYTVTQNISSNAIAFALINPVEFYDLSGSPSMVTNINLSENTATGIRVAGIFFRTRFTDLDHIPAPLGTPYQSMTLNLAGNCFSGFPGTAAIFSTRYSFPNGSLASPTFPDAPGNVTITGSNNNFGGFTFDVLDLITSDAPLNNGGVQYHLQQNYWGGNTNTLDLIPVGGDGIVDIDISNPLTTPIACYSP